MIRLYLSAGTVEDLSKAYVKFEDTSSLWHSLSTMVEELKLNLRSLLKLILLYQ